MRHQPTNRPSQRRPTHVAGASGLRGSAHRWAPEPNDAWLFDPVKIDAMKLLTKALVLVSALFVLLPASVYSQGTIYFSNFAPSVGIIAPVFNYDGVTRVQGPDFVSQLYVSLTPWSLSGVYPVGDPAPFLTGAGDGYWVPDLRLVTEAEPGTMVEAHVRVWSLNGGATYEEADATRSWRVSIGQSARVQVTLGTTENPAYLTGLQSFYLYPTIPEPSVPVLAMAGLLSVGLHRLMIGGLRRIRARPRSIRAPSSSIEFDLRSQRCGAQQSVAPNAGRSRC
jgi:hypothetical protein